MLQLLGLLVQLVLVHSVTSLHKNHIMSLTKASFSMIAGTPVNVVDYISGGTGTVGDPYVGWDTTVPWAANTRFNFSKGVFQYANELSLAYDGISLVGIGVGTILKFTGTGVCVRFEGTGTGVYKINMEGFLIKGNANSNYGIYLTNCHHITFKNIHVVDVTLYAFSINFSVLGIIENFSCTVNGDYSTFMPTNGLFIDSSGTFSSTYSTEQTIINPIIEGVSGAGIIFGRCIFSKIINGTSEANGTGVILSADSGINSIEGIDCESNGTCDFDIEGIGNILNGVISGSTVASPFRIKGNNTQVNGGHAYAVSNTGTRTEFTNFGITGGLYTDTGTQTIIHSLLNEVTNQYYPTTNNDANLFYNGGFEAWNAGTSVAPDGWTLSGAGAAIARNSVTTKYGIYSAQITRSGTDVVLNQQNFFNEIGLVYLKGRQLVFSAWVWASVANVARLSVSMSTSAPASAYHTGDSTWQLLTLSFYVTTVTPYLEVNNTNTAVYFDSVAMNYGAMPVPYLDRPVTPAHITGGAGSAGAGNQYVSMIVDGITYKVLYDN